YPEQREGDGRTGEDALRSEDREAELDPALPNEIAQHSRLARSWPSFEHALNARIAGAAIADREDDPPRTFLGPSAARGRNATVVAALHESPFEVRGQPRERER